MLREINIRGPWLPLLLLTTVFVLVIGGSLLFGSKIGFGGTSATATSAPVADIEAVVPTATPAPSARMVGVLAVSCPSETVCYAAGLHSALFRSTTGGQSWSSLPKPVKDDFGVIACPGVSICYVGGDRHLLATTDSGHTWRVKRSTSITSVSCPVFFQCFAVAQQREHSAILTTTDGGRSWKTSGYHGRNGDASRLTCPSVAACYAVGTVGAIYRSMDSGRTWRYEHNPGEKLSGPAYRENFDYTGVSCPRMRSCFVVGHWATNPGADIVSTNDGGATWHDAGSADIPLNAIRCLTARLCVAVGGPERSAAILVTRDGGLHWLKAKVKIEEALSDISCPSPRLCVASEYQGGVLVSVDGGMTWAERS